MKTADIATAPTDRPLILPLDLTGPALAGTRPGDLDPGLGDAEGPVPFAVLDDATGSVRKAGQMLIRTGGTVILWTGDEVLSQADGHAGPFVADLSAGPVRAALGHVPALRALLPVGQGRALRQTLSLTDDEGKTRARAGLTALVPQGEGRAVTLVRLQRLRGYDRALEALRAHLLAVGGQDGAGSLADPVAAMFPETVGPVTKPALAIAGTDRAWQVATDLIAAHLAAARQREAGIIADHDTEFLHDYRVALRRVRSVVSLFKGVYAPDQTAALKRQFSDLMAPTGRLRDLDVHLLAREEYFAMLPPGLRDGLAVMFDMLARERAREHRRLAARLGSAPYHATMAGLQDLLDRPPGPVPGPQAGRQVGPYARRLIWKRYRKLCALAAGITATTEDAQIHELRIICKKLRYLIEFFAPLFDAPDIKALLKPLKRLQDNLGLFNDYSVQQIALRRFMDSHDPIGHKDDLVLAQSVGALIAILHGRQLAERARVMSSFAQFDAPPTRSMFSRLFDDKETGQ